MDLLQRWEHLHGSVARVTNMDKGTVRLGGGATAVSFLLPQAIAEFQRSHPGVLFKLLRR